VADGDTIGVRLANGVFERVRLLGIETPETKDPGTPVECGGLRSTDNMLRLSFTEPQDTDGDGLLAAEGGIGRRVTLRTAPTQDIRDRFGRPTGLRHDQRWPQPVRRAALGGLGETVRQPPS
jgi:micrococcal nuclease